MKNISKDLHWFLILYQIIIMTQCTACARYVTYIIVYRPKHTYILYVLYLPDIHID